MKKSLWLVWLGVFFFSMSISVFAEELSVPFYYTAPGSFQQPPVTYNNVTYNNLFVEDYGNGTHGVHYINFETWYPRFACVNEPCESGNASFMTYSSGRIFSSCNDSSGECTYPYPFGPAGVSWPLSRIAFLSAPIYKNDFATVYREADISLSSQLTVTRNPEAGGYVVGVDNAISCGNDFSLCQVNIDLNGTATLEAYPNDGYAFTYWDDGESQITGNPHAFTMSSAVNVTAVFWGDPTAMKLPLPSEKSWLLSVEAGGQIQCNGGTDTYHTGSGYYALDFTDNTSEDGHLEGTDVPILAALGGTVVSSLTGWSSSYGWTVVLDHGNGYRTRYAHMKNEPSLPNTVNRGDQIGIMGNSGSGSSGIHLHFQVYHDNDSSSTNTALQSVRLEGYSLDYYQVGCNNYYYSTNQ